MLVCHEMHLKVAKIEDDDEEVKKMGKLSDQILIKSKKLM